MRSCQLCLKCICRLRLGKEGVSVFFDAAGHAVQPQHQAVWLTCC